MALQKKKMALQNIGAGNSNDEFYRYKMPMMITKIEGQGNGIKTNVVNMVAIAEALDRPTAFTTKYFGYELGAQSKFDEKTGVSLVNGAHDTAKLARLLENFISKYVQCYGCGNPETEILITKTQMIQLKCAACGFISDVNMRDKLTKFILKNPLKQKKGSKDTKTMRRAEKERLKEGEAADEELKKMKKEVKKKGSTSISKEATSKATISAKKKPISNEDHHSSPNGSQADENEAANEDWHTDTSLEAARQRIQEQLSDVTAEMVMLFTSEQEKEKPKPAKKVVGSPAARNGGTPKAPEDISEAKAAENGTTIACRHEKLVEKVKMKLKGSSVSQLQSFLVSLDGSPQEVMSALLEALFGGVVKGFSKEVAKKKNYLAAVTQEEGSPILLLRAIDNLCRKSSPEVVKEVALVLKTLYDADVLEEEYIVQWYQEGLAGGEKNSQIWKKVKPFIEWLQNAESESE